MTQLWSNSSRFDWNPCQKTRLWSLLCCKNRSRIHTGSQSCLYRGLLILANLRMSNTECWRLLEDWRRNHIQATGPEEPRLKITEWHYLKGPLNSMFNLNCCLNNDEMFCCLVLPRPQSKVNMRPERIAILSALSLLLFRTSIFNWQIQNAVWFTAAARSHSALCGTKKEWTMAKKNQSPSMLLNTSPPSWFVVWSTFFFELLTRIILILLEADTLKTYNSKGIKKLFDSAQLWTVAKQNPVCELLISNCITSPRATVLYDHFTFFLILFRKSSVRFYCNWIWQNAADTFFKRFWSWNRGNK